MRAGREVSIGVLYTKHSIADLRGTVLRRSLRRGQLSPPLSRLMRAIVEAEVAERDGIARPGDGWVDVVIVRRRSVHAVMCRGARRSMLRLRTKQVLSQS